MPESSSDTAASEYELNVLRDQLAALQKSHSALQKIHSTLELKNRSLEKQLSWFQRQLFGRKSEKLQTSIAEQQRLFPSDPLPVVVPSSEVEVAAHTRKKMPLLGTPDDSGLRFDESQVPVKIIEIVPEELQGEAADEYEVIRMESTYRLAQRPVSYVVLKYVRPVLKHRPSQALQTTPAPANVLEKSLADVSFLAVLIIDKLVYHLPLYRQHQRLKAGHIELSRSTLTNLMNRAAALLEPVAQAVLRSILQSRVLAMPRRPRRNTDARGTKKRKGRSSWANENGLLLAVVRRSGRSLF